MDDSKDEILRQTSHWLRHCYMHEEDAEKPIRKLKLLLCDPDYGDETANILRNLLSCI